MLLAMLFAVIAVIGTILASFFFIAGAILLLPP